MNKDYQNDSDKVLAAISIGRKLQRGSSLAQSHFNFFSKYDGIRAYCGDL
jgi:hypothetical protein